MDHSPPDRIDLTVLKNDVVDAFALDIERKDGIDARIRSKDGSKFL